MENVQDISITKLELNKGQVEGLPKNPRFIRDERYKALVKSIEDAPEMLKLRELLVVEHGNKFVVIGGNMRLRACKELGMETVPCKVLPADTPTAKLREYAIKDNNGFDEDDWDILANEWDAEELEDWGVELPMDWDVDGQGDATATEDDFDESEVTEAVCKRGEVWKLGEHRLMCGDSTNAYDVARLMDGETIPLTLTDPPYRLTTEGGGVLKDSASMKQVRENGVDEFDPLKLNLYSKTNIYTHNKPLIKDYILLAEREGKAYDLGIYKKQGLPNYKGHLMTDIEYIAIIGEQDPQKGYEFQMYSKVYEGKKDNGNELSYSKPIGLCSKFIKLYSKHGDSVLDLFGGSGSTLIACEQLGRKCRMMELDPHYCDVIIARWEKLTGQKAERISDG